MKNNPIPCSQLVEENMDLVPQMVNVLTRNYSNLSQEEYEELTQTSYLALCNAASKYDGHRPFRPYARAAVRNAIYGYWRTVYQYNKRFCSLDALLESEDGHSYEGEFHQNRTSLSTEQEVIQNLSTAYLKELEAASSNMIQKGIATLRLQQDGYTDRDLATLYQVPSNRVRAWQSKARKWLKENEILYELLAS